MVTSKKDLSSRIEEGTTNRSIASTSMNETSSRAHTIFVISLTQRSRNKEGIESSKTSTINLVDLAGSERLSATEAVGDRLKEGVSINQSLACLGNCIHALAESSTGKTVRVPYRESVLTRLLMNALGGNSKTVMIATISPADVNFDETLSTLRYADRAKQIRVHAKINQNQTSKIIQQLREENEQLKRQMASTILPPEVQPSPNIDIEDLRRKYEENTKAVISENERVMREMKESYEEKLQAQLNRSLTSTNTTASTDSLQQLKQTNPYLSNLNFDEQLTGKIAHILMPGSNSLGKSDSCNIVLRGPKILDQHATIYRRENGLVLLEPEGEDARILLNGELVTNKVSLNHHDR